MIGIDLVHVPRLAAEVQALGPDFLDRVFTAAEQRSCSGQVHRLAARWAAKEAALKAFGWPLAEVPLVELEVVLDVSGRPRLVLHGTAAARAASEGRAAVGVSLSHDGDYALAAVLVGAA